MEMRSPSLSRDESEGALQLFVDEMMPLLKPCVLIAAAVALALYAGPQSAEHTHAAVLVDGLGTRSAAGIATTWAQRNVSSLLCARGITNISSPCAPRARSSSSPSHRLALGMPCAACAETERMVRSLDPGPANPQITGERANRSQLQCPGLIGVLGTRLTRRTLRAAVAAAAVPASAAAATVVASSAITDAVSVGRQLRTAGGSERRRTRIEEAAAHAAAQSAIEAAVGANASGSGAMGFGSWIDLCGVPHRHSQWPARAAVRGRAPRVYVYGFMERLHAELLRQPSSRTFFDPWHHHNQFLSEWAFHRSLLASALVVDAPVHADFFFVPFYARLAYSHRAMQAKMLAALVAGLRSSPYFARSGGRDHLLVVSSTRSMEQLYKHACAPA